MSPTFYIKISYFAYVLAATLNIKAEQRASAAGLLGWFSCSISCMFVNLSASVTEYLQPANLMIMG